MIFEDFLLIKIIICAFIKVNIFNSSSALKFIKHNEVITRYVKYYLINKALKVRRIV